MPFYQTLRHPFRRNYMLAACFVFLALSIQTAFGQSTFGSFLGAVKDTQGGLIAGATVTLVNAGTAQERTVVSDGAGQYTFQNIDAGTYKLSIESSGFQKAEFPNLVLNARQTQRVDATLAVGTAMQTVVVDSAPPTINTDTQNIAVTRTGIELNELPLAISSRANGSTSPYTTLTSQAGVQSDAAGTISVAGAKPSLLNVTVDGISTMNVTSSAPSTEMFPSFNSIEEIRVSENANAAEFGGISDITTVSKGGTNRSHGGIFDNYETKGLNAKDPFATTKSNIVMNDFGVFYSGPVVVPHLYSGMDKTFYFLSYEGLRLPKQLTVIQSVPTLAMRNGDLSAYTTPIYNAQGVPYVKNQIRAGDISPVAAKALALLYPTPNFGATGAISSNYTQNFSTPIASNQGDARIDQKITSKQSVYFRYSYKQRATSSPPTTAAGSALIGSFNNPEKDTSLTGAYTYILRPNLLNEFRGGLSKFITERTFGANSGLIGQLGITGIPDLLSPSIAAAPNFQITGFTATGGTGSNKNSSNIYQLIDNVTWTRGQHNFKFGADFRRMYTYESNVFGSSRLGRYTFNGSTAVGKKIGNPLAAFLLGYPDTTRNADVLAPDLNGRGNVYGVYAQDDWKISPYLTVSYGLRYEYHPMLLDKYQNSAQFLPDAVNTYGGVTVHGAVVVPGQYAVDHNIIPAFAAGIAPIQIQTAQQAGITSALVSVARTDFAPRIGFAWRPLRNDKTVVRGGYGRFIATALGGPVIGGWAVTASTVNNYKNAYVGTAPALNLTTPFNAAASNGGGGGTLDFDYAVDPHYSDPIVQQWNLTFEQEIGFNTGLRLSYVGNHGAGLAAFPDLNQLPYNTQGYSAMYASRPHPQFSTIESVENLATSNYNAFTIEGNHRLTKGVQFQTSYTFARNLSEEGGTAPTSNASEIGNTPSDRFHPGLDYGNVIYTRRHRYLGSFLYELPFGRNKMFMGSANYLVNNLVGGWNLSGYLLFQSGPFLTPLADGSFDPTGTGINQTFGNARPDMAAGVSPYIHTRGARVIFNPAAFSQPGNNLARQGTARVGSIVGSGTQTVSGSLMKTISFTERFNLQVGGQVQNIFNHRNFAAPGSLVLGTSNFGQATATQQYDNAGPRQSSLTARLTF